MADSSKSRAARPRGRAARRGTLAFACAGALFSIAFLSPEGSLINRPFAKVGAAQAMMLPGLPGAELAAEAFGLSGTLAVHTAEPGELVRFPLEVEDDTLAYGYSWVVASTGAAADTAIFTADHQVMAPTEPGFYRLALVRDGQQAVVDGLSLAVIVPLADKKGPSVEGVALGAFPFEKKGNTAGAPKGFVRIGPSEANIAVSRNLRVGDFLVTEPQRQWPRYAAIDPRVVDKVELVVDKIAEIRKVDPATIKVRVQSGFRSPLYNKVVPGAANNSRHQYGDAMDVAIDADGDGRFTHADIAILVRAVEAVERDHPKLAGGLGLYTSKRYRHPYAHIDVRGTRARWRG